MIINLYPISLIAQEINDAFEELRSVIPQLPDDGDSPSSSAQPAALDGKNSITKITTLRLAVNYIAALSDILKETDPSNYSDASASGDDHEHSAVHAKYHTKHGHHQLLSASIDAIPEELVDQLTASVTSDTSSLGSLGLTGLELGFDCTGSLEPSEELRASFLSHRDSNHISSRASSCASSSDLNNSHSSPTTTETESLESFTSAYGWPNFTDDDLDVPDTFDLIMESEEDQVLS